MHVVKHSDNCSEGTSIIDTICVNWFDLSRASTVPSCDASLSYQIIIYNKEQCCVGGYTVSSSDYLLALCRAICSSVWG